jgi:hypothetical protein
MSLGEQQQQQQQQAAVVAQEQLEESTLSGQNSSSNGWGVSSRKRQQNRKNKSGGYGSTKVDGQSPLKEASKSARPLTDPRDLADEESTNAGSSDDDSIALRREDAQPQTAPATEELQNWVEEPTDSKALVRALAAICEHLSLRQSQAPTGVRTRFHCRTAPGISVVNYLTRVQEYFFCSDACFVAALVYIDRIVKRQPDFAITPLSIHRLLAVSIVVSVKFMEDTFYSNAYYGKVCGLTVKELNALEALFLRLLDFKLCISPEDYSIYRGQVLSCAR